MVRQRVFSLVFIIKNHSNSSLENGAFERVRDRISLAEFGQKRRKHRLACNSNALSSLFHSHLTLSSLIFRKSSSRAGEKTLSQISTRINNIKKHNLNSREIRTSRAARDSNAVNKTRRVRSRRRCVHHLIYLRVCICVCVCV